MIMSCEVVEALWKYFISRTHNRDGLQEREPRATLCLLPKHSAKCWGYLANETSQILVAMDWPQAAELVK